jgi:hypothetical protein
MEGIQEDCPIPHRLIAVLMVFDAASVDHIELSGLAQGHCGSPATYLRKLGAGSDEITSPGGPNGPRLPEFSHRHRYLLIVVYRMRHVPPCSGGVRVHLGKDEAKGGFRSSQARQSARSNQFGSIHPEIYPVPLCADPPLTPFCREKKKPYSTNIMTL